MRHAWSLFMLVVMVVVLVLACVLPARADSQVFGLPIEITRARGAAQVFTVFTRNHGEFHVDDVNHCGAPATGPAYTQYVRLDDGSEYRTLYASNCPYDMWEF